MLRQIQQQLPFHRQHVLAREKISRISAQNAPPTNRDILLRCAVANREYARAAASSRLSAPHDTAYTSSVSIRARRFGLNALNALLHKHFNRRLEVSLPRSAAQNVNPATKTCHVCPRASASSICALPSFYRSHAHSARYHCLTAMIRQRLINMRRQNLHIHTVRTLQSQ
jgi:hypothetical protein